MTDFHGLQGLPSARSAVPPEMDIATVVSENIELLSTDITTQAAGASGDLVRALARDVRLAVRSSRGLQLTLTTDSYQVSVVAGDVVSPEDYVRSSLRLDLASPSPPQSSRSITFYAGEPGAFVEMAEELIDRLDLSPEQITLDGDLARFTAARAQAAGKAADAAPPA